LKKLCTEDYSKTSKYSPDYNKQFDQGEVFFASHLVPSHVFFVQFSMREFSVSNKRHYHIISIKIKKTSESEKKKMENYIMAMP